MKTPDNSQNHSRLPNEDAPDASRNKNLRLLIAVVITLTIAISSLPKRCIHKSRLGHIPNKE